MINTLCILSQYAIATMLVFLEKNVISSITRTCIFIKQLWNHCLMLSREFDKHLHTPSSMHVLF